MKKDTLNKLVSCLVLLVLLAATLAGAYLGIFGRTTEYATIHTENGDEQRALYRQVAYIPNTVNENWREAIRPSAALGGGRSYALTADTSDSALLAKAAKVLKARATLLAGDADVQVSGSSVTVTVPQEESNSLLPVVLTTVGECSFAFIDDETGTPGSPVLTAADMKQAYYSASNSTYQVQVVFTRKGVQAVQSLLGTNAGQALCLLVDGQPVAYSLLTAPTNDMLAFTASDWTWAFVATDCLRSGALPVSLTAGADQAAEASMGGFLNGVIIAVAIALLLMCVYLVARCGLAGLHGVWALAAFLVLFFLLTATTAIGAGWTMTLASLIVLVLCVCAFVYGLGRIFGGMARYLRNGRSAQSSYADASRKALRPLGILYGAITAAGLLLMFIFQRGNYGVLGRAVALDGILSFVILFLFVRVTLSCCAGLAGKK